MNEPNENFDRNLGKFQLSNLHLHKFKYFPIFIEVHCETIQLNQVGRLFFFSFYHRHNKIYTLKLALAYLIGFIEPINIDDLSSSTLRLE